MGRTTGLPRAGNLPRVRTASQTGPAGRAGLQDGRVRPFSAHNAASPTSALQHTAPVCSSRDGAVQISRWARGVASRALRRRQRFSSLLSGPLPAAPTAARGFFATSSPRRRNDDGDDSVTMKKTKQPSKEQRERDAALIDFANMCEVPFTDLRSYPGESEQMQSYLSVTAILRRLRMAERAGLVPLHGPERRVFNRLKAEIVEKHVWLLNATTGERVTRRIREGTI